MIKSALCLGLLLCAAISALAQEGRTWRKTDIYLNPDRPAVYVDFDRVEESQGIEWLWLRLHNNMQWEIRYETNDIDLKPSGVDAESIRYRGLSEKSSSGAGGCVVKMKELQPGEFIYFRVPLADITYRGWLISARFEFGWEQSHKDPNHEAYFSYFDLPATLREVLLRSWTQVRP